MVLCMLQTSPRTADGAMCINVIHTASLLCKYRLPDTRTPRDHPRNEQPAVTTPAYDWCLRLIHKRGQRKPPTRTSAETPGHHSAWISTQTMRSRLRRFTLRARRLYRCSILHGQRHAARFYRVADFLPMGPGFVSPMVLHGSGCDIEEGSVMPTPA